MYNNLYCFDKYTGNKLAYSKALLEFKTGTSSLTKISNNMDPRLEHW